MFNVNEIRRLDDTTLVSHFKTHVVAERKITAEIVEFIKEVDRRKLYLGLGFTSLFAYLTEDIGYTPGSAQRRIDAARLSRDIPELTKELQSGELNLSQISMVAHGLRKKKKQDPKSVVSVKQRRELLDQVKNQDLKKTETAVAQSLDLQIEVAEKKHYQRDESVRREITLTKEEEADFDRIKDLVSHSMPNASFKELIVFLGREFLKRKDPLAKDSISLNCENSKSPNKSACESSNNQMNANFTAKSEAVACQAKRKCRKYMGVQVRRQTHQKYKSCQWKNPLTGKICGSTFQSQVDHVIPVWAGGTNDPENLQMLCSVHNRLKYEIERSRKFSRPALNSFSGMKKEMEFTDP
jgi:5-methylcytosine-specific restriction endonuclease McrA